MEKIILSIILILLLTFTNPTLGLINVSYPSQVLYGQTLTVNFSACSTTINSTNFPIISSGTEIINSTYRGGSPYGYYVVFPMLNLSEEIRVTFLGEYNESILSDPGIALYGGNFEIPLPDSDQNQFTVVVLTFDGRILLHINSSWYAPLTSLPFYGQVIDNWINVTTPVNYTVIFQDHEGKTLVKEMFINGKGYFIGYLTPIPWNFSYVGIRLDTGYDFVKPIEFYASGAYFSLSLPYVIYVNDKEYTSGFTNSMGQG
ncbi:hypothetical protein CM19_01135 [Candidatus Acidianus copahuensis]|uniref:Thermopsin n=1 Tax=Candidatus Acidianus copahuensis TaxID=1160895 RepID=A0A031LSR2_9CREN|nr:hypothetical protein [Candidatus Acidianus copahuensis]EZQ11422.1 hypothetical protein CM19_01135 [Candidatus Acidianus copahuensis]